MDPLFVLALILGGVATHSWEKGTRRAAASWEQSRKAAAAHRQERDKTRASRVKARKARVTTAKKAGPRDPLWWPYALGWLVAGATRATVAAGQGAREGVKSGKQEGRRFGQTAADRGWKLRHSWQEYRRRRAAATQARRDEKANASGDVVLEECPACGVYVPKLVRDPGRELDRVCEPCAEWRAGEQQPTTRRARRRQEKAARDEAWRKATYGEGKPPKVRLLANGWAGVPEGLGHRFEQWMERRYTCPECGHGCKAAPADVACDCTHRDCKCGPVCKCGRPDCTDRYDSRVDVTPEHQCDGLCTNSDIDPDEADRQGLCPTCGGRGELVWNFGGEHGHFPCRDCGSDKPRFTRPRVEGSVPDDEPDDLIWRASPPEAPIEHDNETGDTTMTAPNGNGAVATIGSGEGFASTVETLQTLARQLAAAHETAQQLAEQLSADELDNDTLTQLNDLMDQLDAGSPLADRVAKHVETRHGPVAEAVAEAGGSTNVARKGWYDEH